ncbi:MAG: potassium channel family protein [Thermosulfidibacteraceae bacterium]|jgi:voltage-gated potassium channel
MDSIDREGEAASLEKNLERIKIAVIVGILAVLLIISIGVVGYILIEGMDFLSALYMTAITITTVGFGEVKPLSSAGRIFTIFLILCGTGTFFYFVSIILSIISEGGIFILLDHYRRSRMVKKLDSHIIVCGYGRVGENVCEELTLEGVPFVVIEKNLNRIKLLAKRKIPFISGLAGEETLKAAGIERAKSLILALGDDVDNLFVALTAKELNPNIFVVARLNNPSNEEKFVKIGVDRIVMPYKVGASRMAQCAIRPAVTSLIDVITSKKGLEIFIEEIEIKENSILVGKSIKELDLRRIYNIMVVAVIRGERGLVQVDPDIVLEKGDILIVLGNKDDISNFIDSLK